MMMEVEQQTGRLNASQALKVLLDELSAVTDYRTLRDTLPRRLARLLHCRCVIFYQRYGDTLQFVSGSFDDKPGWSRSLLAVTHINPVSVQGDTLEALAWRQRKAVAGPPRQSLSTHVATPLLYRTRGIGVLVAIRGEISPSSSSTIPQTDPLAISSATRYPAFWTDEEAQVVEAIAGVVAMLLENTRLLERDRDRIQELSLLNSISRQFHASLHNRERVRNHVIQRAREISSADLCDCNIAGAIYDNSSWISPALQELLLRHMSEQGDTNSTPFIIERPGDAQTTAYLAHLDVSVKTFFAIPLWSGSGNDGIFLPASTKSSRLLGFIVGGYHRPWKLRREEALLLSVLANQAGSVMENIALMEEVTAARNEARKLLRKVLDDQHRQELILESIPSGLLTVDLHGQVTTCNRAAAIMLDCHAFEAIGQSLQRLMPLHSFQESIRSESPQSETLTITNAQGQERILQVMLMPFRSERGELMGTLATLTDMTATHRLEEEKRRLDRLASLGEMAANVAHEVRNPLASIKTSMQMLLDDLDQDSPSSTGGSVLPPELIHPTDELAHDMQDAVKVVLKEVERLDAIVRDLLQFSRPRQLHRIRCSLAEISDRVLNMIEKQCVEAGIIAHRIYRDTPMLSVDVAQIEQVLLNLFLNALQSMPDGGILTIALQVMQQDKGAHDSGIPMRAWIELAVNDTGAGIASDKQGRIFQPFFTTKAHGIGLGLPISRRLVEDHQGQLLVESQLGFGSTFIVRLPLDEQSITEQASHEEEEA